MRYYLKKPYLFGYGFCCCGMRGVVKGFCEIFYFCFRFHRRIPQSACGCQLSTRHALRVPFQGSLDTNEPPLSGEAFLPCEFSSTKLPRRGIQAAAAAVTLPFLQLKLGRRVSGDSPPPHANPRPAALTRRTYHTMTIAYSTLPDTHTSLLTPTIVPVTSA